MRDVLKTASKILFYALALVVLLWTAGLTLDLAVQLLPGESLMPFFILALFDGGALAWCLVFLFQAQGLAQPLRAPGENSDLIFEYGHGCHRLRVPVYCYLPSYCASSTRSASAVHAPLSRAAATAGILADSSSSRVRPRPRQDG